MLAMRRRSIDFFSLDVQGAELDILKTINFNRLNIRTLTVDYEHVDGGRDAIRKFLVSRGMTLYKTIVYDRIYTRDLFFLSNARVSVLKSLFNSNIGLF